MITKISGKLLNVADEAATLGVEAFEYEVLIPEFTRRRLAAKLGQEVQLFTIHYFDGNLAQGRVTPRLVGFLSEVEREFFELICEVDGIGVRKALRAMVRPVQEVATLIEEQDAKGLSALPGVGPATAERMIAKLRRKMPKFALLVGQKEPQPDDTQRSVVEEVYASLVALGHNEVEARKLIDAALATKTKFKDSGALVQAIYDYNRQQKTKE